MAEQDAIAEMRRFLREHSVLGLLGDEGLDALIRSSSLKYYARGSKIIDSGAPRGLRVIYKGLARLETPQGYEYLEEGDLLGLDLLLRGVALSKAEAVEDTVCLLVREEALWSLMSRCPALARLIELLAKGMGIRALEESLTAYTPMLYERRVSEVVKKEHVVCQLGTSIRDAARLMCERHVGSIIVVDWEGRPVGIVTDADLRRALAYAEEPIDRPVDEIMSSPLVKIDGDAPCWEALVTMVERGVKYLPVVSGDRLLGVITIWDLSGAQLQGPALIAREIDDASAVEEMREIMGRVVEVVKVMHREGVETRHIARMLTSLYDWMVAKAVRMAEELLKELSMRSPVDYALMAMGSEGKREQLLKTD